MSGSGWGASEGGCRGTVGWGPVVVKSNRVSDPRPGRVVQALLHVCADAGRPYTRTMRTTLALLLAGTTVVSETPEPLTAQQWPASSGGACAAQPVPEGRVIRGEALDVLTLSAIPGARVVLRSTTATGIRVIGRAVTGPDGSYVFCGVPDIDGLNLQGEKEPVESRIVRVPDDPMADIPAIYLRQSVAADLGGVVVDGDTGEPIDGARIELAGRPARSITDEEGRFQISGVGGGELVLTTSHVAYQSRVDSVDIASGDRLDFEIYLYRDVVALAPIVVRARPAAEAERAASGSRVDFMSRVQIDSLLPQVTDIVSLIRAARFPGVEVNYQGGGGICVSVSRSTSSPDSRSGSPGLIGNECNMVHVYVNGVGMMDPGVQLATLTPESIASLQFLDAQEARIRYGSVRSGVLLITLR